MNEETASPILAPETPTSPIAPTNEVRYVSGFWRRLNAFGLDLSFLLLALSYPAYRLFRFFSAHPGWSVLLGFSISFVYFVILNSRIGGGQTLGKRFNGIRVVDMHGETISPARSGLRFLMFATPVFLTKVTFVGNELAATLDALIARLLTAWILIDIYLFVFNRRTRQSLHDLVAATYVIETSRWLTPHGNQQEPFGSSTAAESNPSPLVTSQRVWLGHGKIILVGLTACLVFDIAIWPSIVSMSSLSEMDQIRQAVLRSGKAQAAAVKLSMNWGSNHAIRHLHVSYVPTSESADEIKQAAEIAAVVLEASPKVMGADVLDIAKLRTADFGFLNYSANNIISHTPADWKIVILATGAGTKRSTWIKFRTRGSGVTFADAVRLCPSSFHPTF